MKTFKQYVFEKKNEEEPVLDIPGQLSLGQEYEKAEEDRKKAEELRIKQAEEAAEDREIERGMYRRGRTK